MSNLPPPPPTRDEQPAPSPKRSTTPWILAAVGVLVIIAVPLAAFLAVGGDDDDDGGDEAASTTEVMVEVTDGPAGPTSGSAPSESGGSETAVSVDPMDAAITVSGDALPPLVDESADDAVGMAAPAIEGTDYDGDAVSLVPGDGPTLVVFLAHWCPHCNAEIPVLNEWRDSGEIPDDLRIVGVSTAVNGERPNYPPGEWLDEMDWQWDVIADGPTDPDTGAPPAGLAYGVSGFPFFVLLDADGNVAARGAGEKPIEELQALVDTVVSD